MDAGGVGRGILCCPTGPGQLAHQATRDIKARAPGTYPRARSSRMTPADCPAGKHLWPSDGGRGSQGHRPWGRGGEGTGSWLVGGPGGASGGAVESRAASLGRSSHTSGQRPPSPKHGTLFPFEWGAKVINTRGGRAGRWVGQEPGAGAVAGAGLPASRHGTG